MEMFGKIVVSLLILAFSALVGAFVLSKLWVWFVVPVFGLPALSVTEAYGLVLVVSYLTARVNPNEDRKFSKVVVDSISVSLVGAVFFLIIGWAVHGLFM